MPPVITNQVSKEADSPFLDFVVNPSSQDFFFFKLKL